MEQLKDKIAMVTGAGRGIGRSVAEHLALAGATVIATARTTKELDQLASDMKDAPGKIIPLPGDITDEPFVEKLFGEVRQRFNRLDILVNNAGMAPFAPVETMSVDVVRQCLELNIVAAFNCMNRAVCLMKSTNDTGKIINIGSVRSHWTEAGDAGAYNASKAGLRSMTESVARQLHGSGSKIAVSLVCPGVVNTVLTNPEGEARPGWLKPADIARSVLHVATAPPDVNVFDVVVIPICQQPW